MNELIKTFEYDTFNITFENKNGQLMINATEMARPFGKIVSEWKRLPSTDKFIEALNQTKGNSHSYIMAKEGVNGGTWLHEDLAIEFARWLSPKFAIWCNDRIKEVMRYGFTATDNKLKRNWKEYNVSKASR